jgi:GNAT superfamily N-acetyltransferase
MCQLTIRKLEPADIPAVAEVVVVAWQTAYRNILPETLLDNLSITQAEEGWSERIKDPTTATLVADVDGCAVGFVRFGASRDTGDDPRLVGENYAIYIHPDKWGLGAGSALLRSAIEELRRSNYKEVTLWTLRDNLPARAFYEKAGLVLDGATKEIERGAEKSVEVRYRCPI